MTFSGSCNDSILFKNNSTGALAYNWIFGDGSSGSQISSTHYYSPGVYTVTLIGAGLVCSDTMSKEINVTGAVVIEGNIPNVFTPNGDEINDRFDFRIIDKCNDFDFEIFDRWGLSILKTSKNRQYFWDGRTTSGEPVPDGTYFYIVNMSDGAKFKGTITLFR